MIVGIAGKAATGKTTAARHMVSRLQGAVQIIPMAGVLRDEVEEFLVRVGAQDHVPLLYGSQQDKVTIFYIDQIKALNACPQWLDYIRVNGDIQDKSAMTAVTTRRILQWWGTEYRRAEDPDYWTKAWGRKVESLDLDCLHVLIDDVRFINELDVIRSHGGLLIKIERPGFNGANEHSSENSLDHIDDWDAVIVNDTTIEQFLHQVEKTFAALGL
ncbi:MAG: hypothetical protein C0614_08515 [Desulfuromonas sp.]|nr:MAG: hypothetical protein C0614_08515 [Desulfuromonas sp.]